LDKVKACVSSGQIQLDQQSSFMAPAKNFPLQVVLDHDMEQARDNNGDQYDMSQAVSAAIAQWNAYGQQTLGQDLFTLQLGSVPEDVATGNPRSCISNGLSESGFYIVHQTDDELWSSLGFTRQIPGATIRCYSGQDLSQQIVMVRPEYVLGSQFTSVILHELGHSLGLDHSCTSGAGSDEYRACDGLSEADPYHMAVMYPNLSPWSAFDNGPEVKDTLQPNDTARADCLYRP
jgi:hypothetical protein